MTVLQSHGSHSLAYSCLQPDLSHFWNDARTGFCAYTKRLGVTLVLGDPICASDTLEEMCASFLHGSPRVAFVQVGGQTANVLRKFNLSITPLGVEVEVDVLSFSLQGRKMEDLRHYRNKAQNAGVAVEERIDSQSVRETLRAVSNAWVSTKTVKTREMSFLARPLSVEPEIGTRVFVGLLDNTIVGYVIFDPIFSGGV